MGGVSKDLIAASVRICRFRNVIVLPIACAKVLVENSVTDLYISLCLLINDC